MASIQTEELECPQTPKFRPIKFLMPVIRSEDDIFKMMNANASFDQKTVKIQVQTKPVAKRKQEKNSLIKFLQAKALRNQQRRDNSK